MGCRAGGEGRGAGRRPRGAGRWERNFMRCDREVPAPSALWQVTAGRCVRVYVASVRAWPAVDVQFTRQILAQARQESLTPGGCGL